LRQSVISGLSAALALTGLAIVINPYADWGLTIDDFALIFIGSAAFVYVGIWFLLLIVDRVTLLLNEIIEVAERIFKKDINQDGLIGGQQESVPRKAEPFEVVWTDPEKRQLQLHGWPVPEEQVKEVGEAYFSGVDLSKRELAKHTSLGQDKALEVLNYMRRKAYAHYIDGNTTELTGRGEHFFSILLSS